jgi:hypothetical protein
LQQLLTLLFAVLVPIVTRIPRVNLEVKAALVCPKAIPAALLAVGAEIGDDGGCLSDEQHVARAKASGRQELCQGRQVLFEQQRLLLDVLTAHTHEHNHEGLHQQGSIGFCHRLGMAEPSGCGQHACLRGGSIPTSAYAIATN